MSVGAKTLAHVLLPQLVVAIPMHAYIKCLCLALAAVCFLPHQPLIQRQPSHEKGWVL